MQPWRAKQKWIVFSTPSKMATILRSNTKFDEESVPVFKTYNAFQAYIQKSTALQSFFLANLMQYEKTSSGFFFAKAKTRESSELLISPGYQWYSHGIMSCGPDSVLEVSYRLRSIFLYGFKVTEGSDFSALESAWLTSIRTRESAKTLSELRQSNSTYIKAWKELSEYHGGPGKNGNGFCSASDLWMSTMSTIRPATAVSESCVALCLRCNSERQDESKQQNHIDLTMAYIYEPHIKPQSTSIQEALPKSGTMSIQRLLDIMTAGYIMPRSCRKCCTQARKGKGSVVRR